MNKKTNIKPAFTLLELVISLGIFMIFTTAIISVFLSVTQATTKANLNREQVSESSQIFQYISSIAKENALDFTYLRNNAQTPTQRTFAFISPDQLTQHAIRILCPSSPTTPDQFCQVDSSTQTRSNPVQPFLSHDGTWTPLHSPDLKIIDLQAKHFPDQDPFVQDQIIKQPNQFQPITHLTLNLARKDHTSIAEAKQDLSTPITLQTSISSRLYNSQ